MPIDAGLYGQFAPRVQSVAEYTHALNAQAMNQLAMQEGQIALAKARQGQADDTGLRNALAALPQGATNEQRMNALRGTNSPAGYAQADVLAKAAQALEQSQAKVRLDDAHAGDFKASSAGKAMEQARGVLPMIQTPQQFAQWTDALYANPATAAIAQQMGNPDEVKSRIPQDPAQFKQFLQMNAQGMDKFIANQTQIRGQDSTAATAKAGQQVTMRGQDSTAATAAAGRAQSERHFGVTDARARETMAQGKTPAGYRANADGSLSFIPGGPADPARAETKPLTETQGKATSFASRMQDADRTVKELEANGFQGGSNLNTKAAGSELTNWMASAEGQKYRQAQENWVTANLRQESGAAIGKEEMAKDIKKFFPIIGDKEDVRAQKSQARDVAQRGMMAQAGPGAKQVDRIAAPQTGGPPVGTVEQGHRFKGGNPADAKNWEKV